MLPRQKQQTFRNSNKNNKRDDGARQRQKSKHHFQFRKEKKKKKNVIREGGLQKAQLVVPPRVLAYTGCLAKESVLFSARCRIRSIPASCSAAGGTRRTRTRQHMRAAGGRTGESPTWVVLSPLYLAWRTTFTSRTVRTKYSIYC